MHQVAEQRPVANFLEPSSVFLPWKSSLAAAWPFSVAALLPNQFMCYGSMPAAVEGLEHPSFRSHWLLTMC